MIRELGIAVFAVRNDVAFIGGRSGIAPWLAPKPEPVWGAPPPRKWPLSMFVFSPIRWYLIWLHIYRSRCQEQT